jgi:hypothetical protein
VNVMVISFLRQVLHYKAEAPCCPSLPESIGGIRLGAPVVMPRERGGVVLAPGSASARGLRQHRRGVNGPSAREDAGWGRLVERRKVGGPRRPSRRQQIASVDADQF